MQILYNVSNVILITWNGKDPAECGVCLSLFHFRSGNPCDRIRWETNKCSACTTADCTIWWPNLIKHRGHTLHRRMMSTTLNHDVSTHFNLDTFRKSILCLTVCNYEISLFHSGLYDIRITSIALHTRTLYLYIGCAPHSIFRRKQVHFFLVRIQFSSVFFSLGLFNFRHRQTFHCLHRNMRRLKIFVRVCAGNCASTEYLLMPLPAIFINSATPIEWRMPFAPYMLAHNIVLYLFAYVLCRIRCGTGERGHLPAYCINKMLAVKRASTFIHATPREHCTACKCEISTMRTNDRVSQNSFIWVWALC